MSGTFNLFTNFVKGHLRMIAGLAIGLLVGSIGSVAVLAAVPNANGSIGICYRTSGLGANGQARIIDNATQSCNSNEAAIAVNKATPGNFLNNLVGADFSDTNLKYRNFAKADLHDAIFAKTPIIGAVFDDANLSNTVFDQTVYSSDGRPQSAKASFKRSNLTQARFLNAINIQDSDFSNSNFTSVFVDTGSSFTDSNFTSVDFRTTTFTGQPYYQGPTGLLNSSNLTNTRFDNQNLSNFYFQGNNAANANFTNVNFTNSYLYGTNLSTATLTGVTWANTQCPDNTNSDDNGNTCVGHLVP